MFISIHGYIYPINSNNIKQDCFFIKGADCWGWATWKRGWNLFENNPEKLLKEISKRKLESEFNLEDSYDYTKMLKNKIEGKNDSWAILWYACAFLQNKLTLYPKKSLIQNIGFDGDGSHCDTTDMFKINLSQKKPNIKLKEIQENKIARKEISTYLNSNKRKKDKKNIIKKIKKLFFKKKKEKYGFFGNYKNWQEVQKQTHGYDDKAIIEKTRNSCLKIKNKEAIYERDTVIFDKIQYSYPLTTYLLYIAKENNNKLQVIDFGGSLGSHYYSHQNILTNLKKLQWSIIEQEKIVKIGKNDFEDDQLKFYYNIKNATKHSKPNLVLMSSCLQYLEKPYDTLKEIINTKPEFIIFDRTSFNIKNNDLLTLQKIPPEIYQANYPAWFLNKEKFLDILKDHYELVDEWQSLSNPIMVRINNKTKIYCPELGFFFKRISNKQ